MYYRLQLTDGTSITPLRSLGRNKFEINSNDQAIYDRLNDFNLQLALLFDENDELVDIFLDFTRQNFYSDPNLIGFKVRSTEEKEEEIRRQAAREEKKRQKYNEKMRQRRQRK